MEALLKANDSMIEATTRVQKKQKVQSEGSPIFETVAMRLYEVHKDLSKNYKGSALELIEIEIRIGMIIEGCRRWKGRTHNKCVAVVDPRANPSLRFRAGIDHIFARKLRAKLNVPMFQATVEPLQIMRCDQSDNRWTVNAEGELLAAERKTALDQINLAMIAHDYDIRINVATETPAPATDVKDAAVISAALNPPVNRAAWCVERRKRRTNYNCVDAKANMGMWRVDYTEVDILTRPVGGTGPANGTSNASSKSKKEIELEFELHRAVMLPWLKEQDPTRVIDMTKMLTHQLLTVLDYCIPAETESERETSLLVVNDTHFDVEINKLSAILKPDTQTAHKKSDFLGAMPVNLTRQNLLEVQKSDYFITEKSDGIRYLLYVVPPPRNVSQGDSDAIAVLVDRSRTVFKFRGCEAVGRALGVGVVLDGELVYNRTLQENIFLVFDALLWRRAPLVDFPFGVRLQRIASEILPAYTAGMLSATHSASSTSGVSTVNLPTKPLRLVNKGFVKKNELGRLLSKMVVKDGERVFFDESSVSSAGSGGVPRHHKSDGFIFQPNSRYVFSKHYELLKWKWPELRSVDLEAVEAPNSGTNGTSSASSSGTGMEWPIFLMCGGPDGTQINCTKRGDVNVGLGEFDAYRLLADKDSQEVTSRVNRPTIVEVAYDIQIGMWAYLHLRPDKDKPNFIDSVMGVFMEQAEAICIEELEFVLTASALGRENDYEAHLAKMKTRLMKWQRSAEYLQSQGGAAGEGSGGASGAKK